MFTQIDEDEGLIYASGSLEADNDWWLKLGEAQHNQKLVLIPVNRKMYRAQVASMDTKTGVGGGRWSATLINPTEETA